MSEKYQALRQTLSSFHYDDDDGLPLRASVVRDLLADHDRLQAQVEQLRTEAKVASDRIQELGRFTKAQRGEIEGLRADAQRYNAFFDAGLPITFLGQPYYTKADLDEAIDSARAGREDGNG